MIYPPGFRWSIHMKSVAGTDLCMHAHVGSLARGQVHVQYADGCTLDFTAPEVVSIEPGHDAWVVGSDAAVLIEFDFEGETVRALACQRRMATASRSEEINRGVKWTPLSRPFFASIKLSFRRAWVGLWAASCREAAR